MKRIAIVLVLLGAACSPQADEQPPAEPVASATPQSPADLAVNMDGTGLSLPSSGVETGMTVPFGSQREAAEHTLAGALGEVQERGENAECGAGPMQFTEYDGVTLNFQEGRLVGWSADGDRYLPEETRGALAQSGSLTKVEGSTLGEEYTLGGPTGPTITMLFDGPGEDAGVEQMWAGTNCVFR